MTVVVRMEPEHFSAIQRSLDALTAEQHLLARWGSHSVELTLAIQDLQELKGRYNAQMKAHADPWSRKVAT